jgi:nucleoside-diphosphate-sugar epimerase
MKIFVTGATGFIGSAVVRELIARGHSVIGLARTDAGAEALARAGVAVQRGDLKDPDGLAAAARASDGVIHTAFIHDFSNIEASGEIDRVAIETTGAALAGSDRPFIIASGTAHVGFGRVVTENDMPGPEVTVRHRIPQEELMLVLATRGVRAMIMRLPPTVHGDGDHQFVPAIIAVARKHGVSAYIGDGANRWPAVHRLDAANVFALAVEKGSAGARYHAVADEGVPMRDIAGVIGKRLGIPVVSKSGEQAAAHFEWLARFVALDCPASSQQTRRQLGWSPVHPGLIPDLETGSYFAT